MKNLLFFLALAPALASAQVQVQAGASFTLDLPIVIPQLVVVQPGIQVVPDVEYEVFHADGFYWTRHEGGWYRSTNPRAGWVYMPRGVPPGLSRMPPGKYKRWKPAGHGGPAPAFGGRRPAVRGGGMPGPIFRGDERHGGRHDDHGRDHDDDRGRGGKKHKGGHD